MDYNNVAAEYARHRRVHPGVFRNLYERGQLGAGSRILEVGCGTGNYITALQKTASCAAWGIDPSQGMLEQAAAQGGAVTLAVGRAEELAFAAQQFDIVFSVDVIHHVQDRQPFFRHAYRVLKPGGRICTVTDSEWIIRHRVPLTAYFPETVEPELKRYPSTESLRQFMAVAGFAGVDEELAEFPYELTSSQPFRDRAYSSLHLIPAEALERGLARMEADLARGSIPCVARYALLWGSK